MNATSITTPPAEAPAAPGLLALIAQGEELSGRYMEACEADEADAGMCEDLTDLNSRIAAYPVQCLDEAGAKARYLLTAMKTGSDPLSFECLLSFVQSFDRRAST